MPTTQSITLHVPGILRVHCEGRATLSLSAANVRTVLEQLEREYPVLHRSICEETGALRRHLNVFVNSDNTRDLEGLDTPIAAGDAVTILPAVSGG